jgi:hypothetical protein
MIKRTQFWLCDGVLREVPFDLSKRHTRKQFPWVPDGVYDHQSFQIRYEIVQGFIITNISKLWLDNGGPDDVDIAMRLPWGTYNDIPPKPQKT